MTQEETRAQVIDHWLRQASEALESATSEIAAGRYGFAANRAYYACFYALSAVLFLEGNKFTKHSGVRAALHQTLIKTGRLDARLGQIYDRVFNTRQKVDYTELFEIDEEEAADLLQSATEFVEALKRLLPPQA